MITSSGLNRKERIISASLKLSPLIMNYKQLALKIIQDLNDEQREQQVTVFDSYESTQELVNALIINDKGEVELLTNE